MKTNDYIKVSFPSLSCNEGFARSCAACFAARLDPTLDELSDIKTAVSEAVTNCIVHAYPGEIGMIHMKCRILGDKTIEISLRDSGVGIADVQKAREPLFTTGDPGERAGMGFSIMESFMDKIKVRSKPDKGTTVVMSKTLNGRR
ncbi:MAG: anti-sigma F factor [Clostridiales bacterium]|nr:anti-sigma F factor [Clostridiales bacterium]